MRTFLARAAARAVTVAANMDVLYGVPTARVAELTGASLVTARRWKRTRRLPAAVRRLLELLVHGELAILDRAWHGWALRGGRLIGPDGLSFEPSEVLTIPFVRAQVSAYQARERYALQADFVEQRYVDPDETLAPDAAHGD